MMRTCSVIKSMMFRNRAETLRWMAEHKRAGVACDLLDHAAGLDLRASVEERRDRVRWLTDNENQA